MKQETFEVMADTLQEAREQAKSRVPPGFFILSETVYSDGTLVTVRGVGETIEDAFARAKAKVPAGSRVEHEEVIQPPETKTIRVMGDTEESAQTQAKDFIVKRTTLVIPGKKGFLRIGKTQNQYDIEAFKQAIAVVTYKTDARVSVTIVDELCDGCYVTCGVCGCSAKVKIFDPGKIVVGLRSIMQSENIALKCQDCGFIMCSSCASPQTGTVSIPTCPSCKKEGGPYFFTKAEEAGDPALRDVCAKCGRTRAQIESDLAEAKRRGYFIYGESSDVLLFCDHCNKSFCGQCQVDLGMNSGCPICRKALD